ncbi:MAG TPA: anti-sigma factor [Phycisphaerae bacterium]|nr:anti-sigma factor [Phycisphaerae bacterium]
MTDCGQADRLSAYYDGEIPEPERAALEAHIRGCPLCAVEMARLQRLSRLIGSTGRMEMSPQALERLHQSFDLQPRIALLHMAEVFASVAASILIVSGVWLWMISTANEAAGQIPVWETVAVAPQDPSGAAAQEQLAQWIIQDLSRKNGHD